MVEGELQGTVEHVGDGPQPGVVGVGARFDPPDLGRDGEVADGHHVAPRVATGVAVGAELREVLGGVDAGLLAQLADRGLVERFVGMLEAAGQRPRPFVRVGLTPHEQHHQSAVDDAHDHHVDRHGERRVVPGVVALRRLVARSLGALLRLARRHDRHPRPDVVVSTITGTELTHPNGRSRATDLTRRRHQITTTANTSADDRSQHHCGQDTLRRLAATSAPSSTWRITIDDASWSASPTPRPADRAHDPVAVDQHRHEDRRNRRGVRVDAQRRRVGVRVRRVAG